MTREEAIRVIEEFQVQADVEEIAKAKFDRPQGKWTKAYDGIDGHVKCTNCFKTYDWDTYAQYYNYCPNCGAMMLGEDSDTE